MATLRSNTTIEGEVFDGQNLVEIEGVQTEMVEDPEGNHYMTVVTTKRGLQRVYEGDFVGRRSDSHDIVRIPADEVASQYEQ